MLRKNQVRHIICDIPEHLHGQRCSGHGRGWCDIRAEDLIIQLTVSGRLLIGNTSCGDTRN